MDVSQKLWKNLKSKDADISYNRFLCCSLLSFLSAWCCFVTRWLTYVKLLGSKVRNFNIPIMMKIIYIVMKVDYIEVYMLVLLVVVLITIIVYMVYKIQYCINMKLEKTRHFSIFYAESKQNKNRMLPAFILATQKSHLLCSVCVIFLCVSSPQPINKRCFQQNSRCSNPVTTWAPRISQLRQTALPLQILQVNFCDPCVLKFLVIVQRFASIEILIVTASQREKFTSQKNTSIYKYIIV